MRKSKRAARRSKQNSNETRESAAKKLIPLASSSFPQTRKRKRSAREDKAPLVCPPSLQDLKDPLRGRDFSPDYSTTASTVPKVRILFRNQKQALIGALGQEGVVVYGCVAWLTDFDILNAMEGKSVGIVVQKEEFLRPDKVLQSRRMWTETLRRKYTATVYGEGHYPCEFPGFSFDTRLSDILPCFHLGVMGPVRCIGYHRRTGDFGVPLMHHKFLVFARLCGQRGETARLEPFCVWTGSFNMSTNASNSLENVVIIDDKRVAAAYSKEWANLYLNSEPLDWTHEYAVQDPADEFCEAT